MNRYHPLLVVLHWLVAIMILISLIVGGPMLADMKNSDPQKITALTGHMIWGLCIGGLMLARLAIRVFTRKPPLADTGHPTLNFGTQVAHAALYVLVFAMVASGLGIAFSADVFAIAFGGSDAALPASFNDIAARTAHGIVATLLLLLIALHVLGWAYHQFVRQDRLMGRMWFGRKVE
ncbi:cytochrome b/b6 domain-containing protein [Nitratireductor sp. XY-223]|uniref:cytochrome b n=1 Tax=Nitratireductor sp. XY-223 TaxID=2561926 RepID=UPI0010AA3DE1|nr:cytochrome b/b6 domain-containing protein [Nitratireductor sp. XY-223]